MNTLITRRAREFSFRPGRRTPALLTVLATLCFCASAPAYDFNTCVECHETTLNGDHSRIYLHLPFAQQECAKCHAAPEVAPQQTETITPIAAAAKKQKTVWLGDSAMVASNHAFMLPGNELGETLVIEARRADGSISQEEMRVPELASLPEVADPGQAPVISELQVLNVQRGVFLSVTIGWQTDSLCDALVRYGTEDLNQTTEAGKRFGRRHEVVLTNLKPGKTYQFSVTAKDLFGRQQVSQVRSFSTTKPMTTPARNSQEQKETVGAQGISGQFKRAGIDYLCELTLATPASVFVGSKGLIQKKSPTLTKTTATAAETNGNHEGLSSESVTSIAACMNCHPGQKIATHPINVFPKPGMVIPPEYPTLKDGRISCVSCHSSHSSYFEFLSRKPSKRELCVGCHVNML